MTAALACALRNFPSFLAQSSPATPSAATLFYLTLVFIFLTAVVTTVATKWARDKCLKLFHGYHITLERARGQTTWGRLKVFPTGVEVVFDHPFVDVRGRKKTSTLFYAPELDGGVLSFFRYAGELDKKSQRRRRKQVRRGFNPGPLRRFRRRVRNVINTLRDAFNAAIGAVVGQYQRLNPGSVVLGTQGGQSVTAIGQTLLGRFAGNAYEPLLEQHLGRPVILEVADPLDPNNKTVQYAGYLADYTQAWIAVFNVEHAVADVIEVGLPDVDRGDPLPPLPAPPPLGGTAAPPPPAARSELGLDVRLDGPRMKVTNAGHDPVVVRRLEREGFEPLTIGMVIPPNGMIDLPARDARGGRLCVERLRCLDVVAPRKYAVVRHAGELVERRGFAAALGEELGLSQLPLVPRFLGRR